MTIAIDLTSLSYHISGIERYALCVSEEILKQNKKDKFILVFRETTYPAFNELIDNERVKAKVLHGNHKLIFNQIILPLSLYHIKADRYLFLAFANPILFRKKGIISILHDMGAFDFSQHDPIVKKIYFRTGCYAAAWNSEALLTVSEFSKKRICILLKVKPSKVHVVPSAVPHQLLIPSKLTYNQVKKKYNLPDKYVMTLSTLEPRKNMKLLLDAFDKVMEQVDYDVVLVGRKGWQIEELLQKIKANKRIHVTGFVNDDEVSLIYKHAECFVFPTLYEGFGLPPVEALALGTPVISSDAASMPEVLRNQATYFKSNNLDDLADRLLHLEERVKDMPHELDEYQKEKYDFAESARKILNIVNA